MKSTNEFIISTAAANSYYSNAQPKASLLSNNETAVIYAQVSTSRWGGISVQIINFKGSHIGSEINLNKYSNYDGIGRPAISALHNDSFVTSWYDSGYNLGNYDNIIGRFVNNSGVKLGQEFLINQYTGSTAGDGLHGNDIATLKNGDIVYVWNSANQDSSSSSIYAKIADYDNVIKNEFKVNSFSIGTQESPAIAALKKR